jgi:large subunit ribosomal protein L28
MTWSTTMANICQVTGKKANNAKHIRHRHSGQWKFRAPKKNRLQLVNLKSVRVKTDHGVVTLRVAASVLKSPEFNAVVCGLKPIPKAWLKKPSYGI